MKTANTAFVSFLAVLLLMLCADRRGLGQTIPPEQLRQRLNFNRDWRFTLGDQAGASAVTFDDQAWQRVNLPHSFSMPYFQSPDFYVGYGWYRKHFNIPTAWDGKRIALEFEGAFRVAEIFINGKSVGEHHSGYTGFAIDITDAVKPGDNVVAIRLNNLWNAQLAPRAGEHVFSGGIYRDVHLVATDPLHITWYGTTVTTPQVSKETASVEIKTEVSNENKTPQSATVTNTILDADQAVVAQVKSTRTIPGGATVIYDHTTPPLSNPKLWSPKTPNLYTVRTTVSRDGKPIDDMLSSLGFRWFKFTPDKGFFLNGEHHYFKGANVHQDHAGWGDAVTNAGFARDVKMVKDAGFDFIRGSHYPHDPSFSDACDRLGILFWSENDFWGSGGLSVDGYYAGSSAYPTRPADCDAFDQSVLDDLRAMIRVHRNHPSIVVWSTGNEDFFSATSAIPRMRELLKKEVALIHKLDPTRPAGIGGAQRPLDDNRIDKLGDVAGYNGDGSTIALFQNPGIPSVVTEYGSVAADRPGKYDPGWGDLSKIHGESVNAWRSGQSLWCAFDHGSLAGARLGKMGIVDYFRIPKRAWYWYRNEYAHIPPPTWPTPGTAAKLKLEADQTVAQTDGTDDVKLTATVLDASGNPISNSPPVRFEVVSGPGEFPTGPSSNLMNKAIYRSAMVKLQ